MFSIQMDEHERHPAKNVDQPGGNHVKEFIIVHHHQVAGPDVAQDVAGVKKPGKRNAQLGNVPVGAEQLPVGGKLRFQRRQPFPGASFHRPGRGGEHDQLPA